MSKKIITAGEAVYVSELNPCVNYAHSPIIVVGFSGGFPFKRSVAKPLCFPAENIGLLQFTAFDLPPHYEILKARLHLFVCHAHCRAKRIQIYSNAEPFNGTTVNWITKPDVQPGPIAALCVEKPRHYAICDITQFIRENQNKCITTWGFSLMADRENAEGVVVFSNQAGFLPYISISYCKKPLPPSPREIVENIFCEHIWEVAGNDPALFSPSLEVSQARKITFFIENTGIHSFSYNLQISPDGVHFIDDKQTGWLEEAHSMEALTPYLFAKYMRVRIQPALAGESVHARIWCQMQTHNYLLK